MFTNVCLLRARPQRATKDKSVMANMSRFKKGKSFSKQQLKIFKAPVQWGPLVSSLPRTWTRSGRHFVTTTDDLFTGGFPKGEGGLRFVLKKIWLFKTTELIYSLEEKRNACLKLQVCISCREDVVGDVVDDHHWEMFEKNLILDQVMCRKT